MGLRGFNRFTLTLEQLSNGVIGVFCGFVAIGSFVEIVGVGFGESLRCKTRHRINAVPPTA